MQVMRCETARGMDDVSPVLAVGRFDGMHLGHQRVIEALRVAAAAHHVPATVALYPRSAVDPTLTSIRRTLALLRAAGVARVVLLPRDERRDRAAIAHSLGATTIVGGGESSDGGTARSVLPVLLDGTRVTSQRLCALVASGELETARRGLGRWHGVDGRVVHGHHRGAPLGIPTANLRIRGIVLPPDGVYAVDARVGSMELRGVANIGFNPTFGNTVRSVETHLLDFEDDLYGKRLEVAFRRHLRGERRFSTVEELLAQIRRDVTEARAMFAALDG